MQVRHLLSMSTGHRTEPRLSGSDQPWTKTFLAHDVPYAPGTQFLYNTAATYMVSAIIQKQTGQTVLEYLGPRLFEPLGIENPRWGTSPQGISLGGYGLRVRTEDIAKLGQLYLQQGTWRGESLLPATWVKAATSKQIANGDNPQSDWNQGYGYQFWRCRHNCYRGDGAFGQYCIVLPEQDAVVAITSGVKDMQAVLNLVWDKLLPALHSSPLEAAPEADQALQRFLGQLVMPMPQGAASTPMAQSVLGREYRFPANAAGIEAITLRESGDRDETVLIMCRGGKEQSAVCGHGRWVPGQMTVANFPEKEVACSGGWTSADTYTAKICFRETPHCLTLKLNFHDDTLTLDAEMNVAFGPTKQPQLVGHRQTDSSATDDHPPTP